MEICAVALVKIITIQLIRINYNLISGYRPILDAMKSLRDSEGLNIDIEVRN
jgi:hypothetical protein